MSATAFQMRRRMEGKQEEPTSEVKPPKADEHPETDEKPQMADVKPKK